MAAVRAGADAVGLNFYSRSPRYIGQAQAREIILAVADARATSRPPVVKVGVFVNATVSEIRQTADDLALDFVQLHGDEPPEMIAELAPRRVIRAFRLAGDDRQPILDYLAQCRKLGALPAAVLIDAFRRGGYGGTGETADWNAAAKLREELTDLPLILAGGLTSENVAAAIAQVRPAAVDTASGEESAPGMKDEVRLKAFVSAAIRAFDG